MRIPDETTATDRHRPSEQPGGLLPLVWKLRVVFTGAEGIVEREALAVRGRAPILLGRGSSTAVSRGRVSVDDPKVSREHARIQLDGERLTVRDLGSKNGSALAGRALAPDEPRTLADGDVLRLGDSFVIVRREVVSVPDAPIASLVGVSQTARNLRSAVARCAPDPCSVLLLGETGAGKGAAATAIHALSGRSGRLVEVNCAAVPAELAEGILFGVRRGAYTGAVDQPGFFREAHDGTLLLDEIGDLPPEMQPKLLQAIERQQATPLGSARPVPCNVRIVAATHRNLDVATGADTFRQDLYHRLASFEIRLHPLRERREDILLLARHLAGGSFQPSAALVAAMLHHVWPGNVREVANLTNRVRLGDEAQAIRWLASRPADLQASPTERPWKSGDPIPSREEILALLERYGSLNRIDQEVGYSRRQFKRWMDEYGIPLPASSSRRDA